MSAQLRISSPQPAPPAGDAISIWLETLSVLLKMPSAKRDSIRDELESHLRERVRDLMVKGQAEPDAVRHAIGELGDAVKLAQRLSAAGRNPRRRLVMNLAVFGVAGAALLTSVAAFRGTATPNQPEAVKRQGELASKYAAPSRQETKPFRVSVEPDTPMGEFFHHISQASGMPVAVRWNHLEAIGANTVVPLDHSIRDVTLREAFDLFNEYLNRPGDGIDFRINDGRMTIATIEYFDKTEMILAAYDLRPQMLDRAKRLDNRSILDATKLVTSEVSRVIEELVHKEHWVDNGGDRASIAVYGTKLFIRAPKRFHPEIEWVISQLPVNDDTFELGDNSLLLITPEVSKPEIHGTQLIINTELAESELLCPTLILNADAIDPVMIEKGLIIDAKIVDPKEAKPAK